MAYLAAHVVPGVWRETRLAFVRTEVQMPELRERLRPVRLDLADEPIRLRYVSSGYPKDRYVNLQRREAARYHLFPVIVTSASDTPFILADFKDPETLQRWAEARRLLRVNSYGQGLALFKVSQRTE